MDTEAPAEPRRANPFVWIWKHPKISAAVGGFVTAYGIFDGVRTLVSDLATNLAQIVGAPDHLWLRWIFILAGLGLIAWGAWRSDASKEEAEALAKEEAQRLLHDAACLPVLMAASGELFKKLLKAEEALQKIDDAVRFTRTFASNPRDKGAGRTFHGEMPILDAHRRNLFRDFSEIVPSFVEAPPVGALPAVIPHQPFGAPEPSWRVEDNAEFFRAALLYTVEMEAWIGRARAHLVEFKREEAALEGEIRKERSRLYGA